MGRLHAAIGCHRLDWLHKLTTEIARTSGIVAVEDLHVKGLIRNRCLSRSFSDAAVGKLLDLLERKVPLQGGLLLKVDRFFPSSQICHCCGARKKDLTLADRVFVCPDPDCGYLGDRDENASLNLVLEALRLFGLNLNMPSQRVATAGRKIGLGTWGKTKRTLSAFCGTWGGARKNKGVLGNTFEHVRCSRKHTLPYPYFHHVYVTLCVRYIYL